MNTNEFSRAVSPVVGVIFVVAITVTLSGVVGVFVFDLGQSVSDSTSQSDIATRTTYNDDGTASIQVVTGESDALRVLVNGTEDNSTTNPTPGTRLTVAATAESSLTIISERNGQATVVASSSSSTGQPVTAPSDGLIAHWSLAGTTNNTESSNDVSLAGNAAFVSDASRGEVLSLDGSGDYASADRYIGSHTDITLSVWVYNDDTSGGDYISLVEDGAGWPHIFLRQGSNGEVRFRLSDSNANITQVITDQTFPTSEWYMVTVVRNTSNGTGPNGITFYVNATTYSHSTEYNQGTAASVSYPSTAETWLGARDSSTAYHDGKLSEAYVYDRALTPSEINDLYNATK